MNFVNPLFLAGLAAIGIPIAIHLLAKQPPRTLLLPTMILLLEKNRKDNFIRMHRLREIILLLLRMAVIFLLVLFFAGLVMPLDQKNAAHSFTKNADVVFVVDSSASMGCHQAINHACDEIRRILSDNSFRTVSLYTIDCRLNELIVPGENVASVQIALESLKPSLFHSDLASGLETLEARLKELGLRAADVVLFTDLQMNSMGKDTKQLGKLSIKDFPHAGFGSLRIIDMSNRKAGNCHVAGWSISKKSGADEFVFSVRNSGQIEQNWSATLSDSKNLPLAAWSGVMQPGEEKTCPFILSIPDEESWRGNVKIGEDAFELDNTFYAVRESRKRRKIPLVAEEETSGRMKYAEAALRTISLLGEAIDPVPMDAAGLAGANICNASLLVLHSPSLLGNKEVRRFLAGGGRAMVFSSVSQAKWSQDGIACTGEKASEKNLEIVAGEEPGPFTEPFWFMSSNDGLRLQNISDISLPGSASIFARYSNNIPAIAEMKISGGRVMLLNFPCDGSVKGVVNNMWFAMIVRRAWSWLTEEDGKDTVAELGARHEFKCDPLKHYILLEPGGAKTRISPDEYGRALTLPLLVPGVYELREEGSGEISGIIAVNMRKDESELKYYELDGNYIENAQERDRQMSSSERMENLRRLGMPLAAVILLLLLVEMYLERGRKNTSPER